MKWVTGFNAWSYYTFKHGLKYVLWRSTWQVVKSFCIYYSPEEWSQSIPPPTRPMVFQYFFAGMELISFVSRVAYQTKLNLNFQSRTLCFFITQPLFVLKTWEICFVVDLPAVLRQLTTRQAFNSIYLLLKLIYMTTAIWENRA